MDKLINVYSGLPEFGYELLTAVPYSKWLFDKKILGKTISGRDTKCLYWWSEHHIELDFDRGKIDADYFKPKVKLPNKSIHDPNFDFTKFSNPDWVIHYKNSIFIYSKPILCICNRINREWTASINEVVNWFDLELLNSLFNMFKPYYQIIYFNIEGRPELYDLAVPISIGDFDFIKQNHPEVLIIHDIYAEHKELTFNQLQLMLFANSKAFITMNGGYAIMASYFTGTNIIYSKFCAEIKPEIDSFRRWYHKLGGQTIVVVNSYEDLLIKSKEHFLEGK